MNLLVVEDGNYSSLRQSKHNDFVRDATTGVYYYIKLKVVDIKEFLIKAY